MDIAIIANGFSHPHLRDQIFSCQKKIAVDGGISHLDEMGIIPDLWVGDFDSSSAALEKKYHHLPRKTFAKDKDLTDTELAIKEALLDNPSRILLFAGTGNRIDHTVCNLFLLGKYVDKLYLVTDNEVIFAFSKKLLLSTVPQQRLSFLPLFGPVKVTKSEGLRWPLTKKALSYTDVSLSNEALAHHVEITLSKGLLLCVASQ